MHPAVGESRTVNRNNTMAPLVLPMILLAGIGAQAADLGSGPARQHSDGHAYPYVNGPAPRAIAASGEVVEGKVLETMDAGGYTYVRVATPEGDVWAAGPRVSVKVGDAVAFGGGMPMVDFHSKGLDRDFEKIYFVGAIRVGNAPASAPSGETRPHGAITSSPSTSIDLSAIPRAEGGVTVGTVFAKKSSLAGTEVVIRAKVVKSNTGIMGKNWLHLRDGTAGPDGEDDLTVTTSGTARVGETVIVRGKVTTDKDFGFGYRYDVILEDATVTVEGPST